MNKSGTLTYTVDDAANFRSAISAAASSHTHPINQITWAGGLNLAPTATANSQEWSIDLTPGSYTGTYFHIYSAKNSKSILQCFTDSNEVVVPSGNLKVTGGKIFASKTINQIVAGTGTAAQDKGSGVSPRYFPARWAFNMGIATPTHGDIITIKIPVAGHDYGVFISTDNGTTYRPVTVAPSGTSRLTTHYANGALITLIYDSAGATNSVYAAAGADARSNVTGGCWRVVNYYDTGNTYDRNRFNASIKAWGTKIIAGNIIVGINGLYHHLKEGTEFDITYPILYLNGDCNANSTTTNTYDIINFTITTTQSITLTAYKPVYIKGTLSGVLFTPYQAACLTQTVPTTDDGYHYMFLGNATSTTAVYLQERHPIYTFVGGKFQETSVSTSLRLSGSTTATMSYDSTNPQISFSENGGQGVKLLYSDYDSYRAPYGLKVIGNNSAGAAWFEVEGSIFCNSGKYNSYFTATPTSGQVVITDGTTGGTKSSGYTIAKSVPSNADFTNTWRGIQDNLTSDSTTDSLSAKQGKNLANGSARDSTKLPLAGGTMTGQLKTSFKESVAMGSYAAAASTIPNLCTELRYSSGAAGSCSIGTAYTKDSITIATGWYNFIWVPHRSGGVNGAASGDNCDYGSLYLSGMTVSGCYMIRFSSGAITELKNLYADNTNKVAKAGDSMTGCLKINSTTGDFSEGLRLNLASNGYTTLTIGTTNGSTNGISDGGFWIGTYTGTRKLYIAHNASTQSATYFGADSSNAYSPYLNLGSSGTVESGNTRAVTGGAVYSFMQPGVKTFQVERGSSFSTSRQGYWAGMLRTDQSGSPTLPIANKWFHVLSMDWSNDSANWVSQLAIGTQEDPNSGVWWRCNNAGGTDISSSTWKHLVEDTQAPPQHNFDFTLTSDNNNKWYKVLSRGNGVPSTSSFKGIITVSVPYYGYTNGTTKSFMVQSSYQSMTLYPFDSIGDEVGWLPTWRVSADSTNMYIEFYVSNIAASPAQNAFRITYTSLSNTHSGDPITFYDTLTQSTATAVVQQYTIKAAFRTLTASEALEAGSATWTRTASTAGSVTLRRYGKVKELVIWGTALPAVSGAAVSTLQLSDPSYYPLHNNVQFVGSDDNSQIVLGYITTGGTVYIANRSTSPIYCNVTYM